MKRFPLPFAKKDLLFLVLLSVLGAAVGLRGILRYGYIGQDFNYHHAILLGYPGSFNFFLTNPPGLYWFGNLIRQHVSAGHYLEGCALAFLVLNTLALWLVYGFLWRSLTHWSLRCAAAAFVTFLPFRVIHAVVFASDAFTLPFFALAAFFTLRLMEDPRRIFSWLGLSLGLSAGMLCKYTFIGVLPPIALVLAVALGKQLPLGGFLRWGAIGVLSLALPAGIFLSEISQGNELKTHWLPEGAPVVMRWSDILTVQKGDAGVFSAPEYFRDQLYHDRPYSYPALLHLSAVTDCLSFFQAPPPALVTDWDHRMRDQFARTRSPRSQRLQTWSVRWSLPFTALAVIGTLFCGVLSLQSLVRPRPLLPNAVVMLTTLAVGFYSPIFLNLHRVGDPYGAGYWLPRLILPALLVFYALGFVMIDFVCLRLERFPALRIFRFAFAGYTLVACLLFVSFLI